MGRRCGLLFGVDKGKGLYRQSRCVCQCVRVCLCATANGFPQTVETAEDSAQDMYRLH